MNVPPTTDNISYRAGLLYSILAYATWGLGPIYFKAIAEVPPAEVLAHRIVWSVVFLFAASLVLKNTGEIRTALTSWKALRYLGITTVLIAVNWYSFIWSIENRQVLQASLGYFINPLITVLLGALFLKEKLRCPAQISIIFAAVGVVLIIAKSAVLPVAGLVLAVTFAFYALLRKTAPVEAVPGLTVETTLLGPLALVYLFWLGHNNAIVFGNTTLGMNLFLIAAGPVTSLPLIWFAKGTRRLRLSTVGFLQYISPSLHFLLAVVIYGEPFGGVHLLAFLLIWTGLAIFTLDSFKRARKNHRP
jgi:chloramphenicol-sensitive protein RarD